jgi:hypothetical protein
MTTLVFEVKPAGKKPVVVLENVAGYDIPSSRMSPPIASSWRPGCRPATIEWKILRESLA